MTDTLIHLDKQLLLLLNGSDSLYVDAMMSTLTAARTWIPLYIALFYLVIRNNDSVRKIVSIVGCALLCVLLAGTIDDTIVKPLVQRWRPTHDPEIGVLVDIVDGYSGGNYGFFSAHAANTFSIAVFFILVVRNVYLSISLVTWSLVNCWTRLYLGVHYPGDILVGLLWGGAVALGVYIFYQRLLVKTNDKGPFVSTQYSSTGYVVSDVDMVIAVLAYTFVYAQLRACFLI